MRWIRTLACFLLPCAAGSGLLFTGALGQQTTPPAQTTNPAQPAQAAQTPPPPKPDENATKTLAAAIDVLEPRKLGWFETTLWQRVETQGLTFLAEGRYLGGPNHRMRLDLRVTVGKTTGETSYVSDGATVWNSMQIGGEERQVTKWDLKKVTDVLNSPGTLPQFREEFFRAQAFYLLTPMLQTLKQQVVFTRQEADKWKDRDVHKLTGVWTADISKGIAPSNSPWPLFVPRTCRLYLDRQTLWPYRFEWWGPVPDSNEDVLLTQIEFRNPKITKADQAPSGEFTTAFAFNPGKANVVDATKEMTEMLTRARMQQSALSRQPGTIPVPTPSTPPGPAPKP